jgi:CHAT domain-containing protein/tetratricopeptide (TPR) repeat protein
MRAAGIWPAGYDGEAGFVVHSNAVDLQDLVKAWLSAPLAEKRRLLETDGVSLLDPSVEATLRAAASSAAARGAKDAELSFCAHAELLAACRAEGVASSFARMRGQSLEGASSQRLNRWLEELQSLTIEAEHQPSPKIFRHQIELCDLLLREVTREVAPAHWAALQGTKGNALQSLGELSGDATTLRRSEVALREALKEFTRERAPMEWARTHNSLGNVLATLGELTGDAAMLRRAEAACREALEEFTRKRAPLEWAATQNTLGNALTKLGDLTGDPATLGLSETAYREALREFTPERAPMQWAMTQHNLGYPVARLGELTGDASALRRAEAAYRCAFKEYTRERAPMDWARTQNNIGNVLRILGEFTGDAETLRRSEAAYRESLKERTRERAPLDWAATQNNLGIVLFCLHELTGDATTLIRAEAAYRYALQEYTRQHAPLDWAMTQQNLGNVLQKLGGLTRDAAAFRRSEAAYRDALEVRTRERAPMEWAGTQNNLGNVLRVLGELTGVVGTLRQSEAAYREALEEVTRERAPMQWAMTQHSLGNVLVRVGDVTSDARTFHAASAAYRGSLDVRTGSGAEDSAQATAVALSRLLTKLASGAKTKDTASKAYLEAERVIEEALARSDAALLDAERSLDGRHRAVEQVERLYALLSLCRVRLGETKQALQAAESGRARLAVETRSLAAAAPSRLHDPESIRKFEGVRARREGLRRRLGIGDDRVREQPRTPLSPAEYTALKAEFDKATSELLALYRSHGLMSAIEPLAVDQIIAAAPEGGAIVLPVIADAEAFAFVVARAGIEVVEFVDEKGEPTIDGRRLVEGVVDGEESWLKTRDAMLHGEHFGRGSQPYVEWTQYVEWKLQWLWGAMFGALDGHLEKRLAPNRRAKTTHPPPVVLLPPGLLGALPLAGALPDPHSVPFGERWTLSFAPSVRALIECRERARQARHADPRLLGVIDPVSTRPGVRPLAGARLEAEWLKGKFGNAQSEMLPGGEAHKAAVLRSLRGRTHLHFSTHGFHDPVNPGESGLVLAGEDMLKLSDLNAAQLDGVRLTFLSACETGLAGVMKMADEFYGLASGFVMQGSAGVVASLWPVFDDASYLLTTRFYDEWLDKDLEERTTPAEALRAAQAWLRNVTYGELRQEYVEANHNGEHVLLLGRRCKEAKPAYASAVPIATSPDCRADEEPGFAKRWLRQLVRAPADVARPPGTDKPLVATEIAPSPIAIVLGPDNERPFKSPHEWCAFNFTGA